MNLFFRLVLGGIAGLGYLAKGQFGNFFAIIKAHFAFYALIKSLKLKRIEVLNLVPKYQINEMVSSKTLIYEYFKNNKLGFKDLGIKIQKIN